MYCFEKALFPLDNFGVLQDVINILDIIPMVRINRYGDKESLILNPSMH